MFTIARDCCHIHILHGGGVGGGGDYSLVYIVTVCSRRNAVWKNEAFIIVVDECRFDLCNSLDVVVDRAESIHAHKQSFIVEETTAVV